MQLGNLAVSKLRMCKLDPCIDDGNGYISSACFKPGWPDVQVSAEAIPAMIAILQIPLGRKVAIMRPRSKGTVQADLPMNHRHGCLEGCVSRKFSGQLECFVW